MEPYPIHVHVSPGGVLLQQSAHSKVISIQVAMIRGRPIPPEPMAILVSFSIRPVGSSPGWSVPPEANGVLGTDSSS